MGLDLAAGAHVTYSGSSTISRITSESVAYGVLRASFGIIMVTHGLPKLLGLPHGSMADPMAGATRLIETVLHLPAAPALALLAALLEAAGGSLVALGLFTRPIAALMAVELAAICYVHAPTWAWIDRGMEYPLLMLCVAVLIAARGSGSDAVPSRRDPG
jgi:putative oxidoreductase